MMSLYVDGSSFAFPVGPGEDRCLHEFWPVHEGSCFLENCPVEQQKGVGSTGAQQTSNKSLGMDPLQHLRRSWRPLGPL